MTEHLTETLPDVFPAIVVDRAYGQYVDMIDIDLVALTHHLRSKGMTDEQISDLTIELSSNGPEMSTFGEAHFTSAYYKSSDKSVKLYNAAKNPVFEAMIDSFEKQGLNSDFLATSIKTSSIKEMNGSMLHELDHAVAEYDKGSQQDLLEYKVQKVFEYSHVSGSSISGAVRRASTGVFVYMTSPHIIESLTGDEDFSDGIKGTLAIATYAGMSLYSSIKYRALIKKDAYEYYYNNPMEVRARQAQEEDLQLLKIDWQQQYLAPKSPSSQRL